MVDLKNMPQQEIARRRARAYDGRAEVGRVSRISQHQKWIDEHGGSLAGYIARYGSKDDPSHYGDGGEAIYEADVAELERLKSR